MDLILIDPSELEIDPLNERTENVGPHQDDESLEESIREQGVVQPPVARKNGEGYKVVVGQRRTLAAQAAGVEQIPVLVADWDDSEALEASITENIGAFNKAVSKTDRARALKKLLEINDWSRSEAAEQLGVSKDSIRNWLERTRDEWKDTQVHVDSTDDTPDQRSPSVEEIPDTSLQTIRRGTEDKAERDRIVEKVSKEGLGRSEIREAKKRSENSGESFEKSIQEVSKESNKGQSSGIKARVELTFSGEYAIALREAAKDLGASENKVVEEALKNYLSEEGYL